MQGIIVESINGVWESADAAGKPDPGGKMKRRRRWGGVSLVSSEKKEKSICQSLKQCVCSSIFSTSFQLVFKKIYKKMDFVRICFSLFPFSNVFNFNKIIFEE